MKKTKTKKIVYSINIADIQEVSQDVLDRPLARKEIEQVERSIGDYIDWFQAIESAIHQHIQA